ncbi:MAG: amino acid ABC transporter ATP-binding protein, partial [Psychrilyobacter sp.]|uniref:amino acid ABC transporter ATP-binding protein n=1 Tax=Psychrilyobacter sp. TaxID=2586924 RepID=UPI003C72C14E
MVEVKKLHKSFGGVEVLKGIDFSLEKGEIVSIIGPSGSGKSTFLRCLNYLEVPTKGSITIDDLRLEASNHKKKDIVVFRQKTSMVFQNYNLFKNKTALENITEALIIVKKIDKRLADKKGKEIIKKIGLEGKEGFYPNELSGGQQQRIGIGRAMALENKLILLDEPTSALDPELVGEVLDLIRLLVSENISMIIVTHEMKFAREVSDRVIFMEDGMIIECGTPNEILVSPKNKRIESFLGKSFSEHIV